MEHIYIMVSTLGFTCDAMLSSRQGLPKAGLLVNRPQPDHAEWRPCPCGGESGEHSAD